MSICKENGWQCLIRFKSGSIPTLAQEFNEIVEMGEADEKVIQFENIYKKRWLEIEKHQLTWVNEQTAKTFANAGRKRWKIEEEKIEKKVKKK